MKTVQITWLERPDGFAGEPGASLALTKERWTELGAHFAQVEDGAGAKPGLAVARIETEPRETLFGVLDYGSESTYLLVPATEELGELTSFVLAALLAAGWIQETEIVDKADAPSGASDIGGRAAPEPEALSQRIEGKLALVSALTEHPMRFAELRETLRDLTDSSLSQGLRELEEAGAVKRSVEAGTPVRVTYVLSDRFRGLSLSAQAWHGYADLIAARRELRGLGDIPDARLLATQMAVSGSTRSEIEERLRNAFAIEDPEAILDAILGPEPRTLPEE